MIECSVGHYSQKSTVNVSMIGTNMVLDRGFRIFSIFEMGSYCTRSPSNTECENMPSHSPIPLNYNHHHLRCLQNSY